MCTWMPCATEVTQHGAAVEILCLVDLFVLDVMLAATGNDCSAMPYGRRRVFMNGLDGYQCMIYMLCVSSCERLFPGRSRKAVGCVVPTKIPVLKNLKLTDRH